MNSYNFQNIWDSCLQFNIEQKPEEFKALLDFLNANSKKRIALEIGSNYGGFAAGLCELFDKVITIDIKHNTNFDLLKNKYSNYEYIISDSTNNDTINYLKSLNIKFDFIFIDGDHSYDGVKSDYLKFKQLLNSDGYLGFHDVVSSPENEGNRRRGRK
jgi:predicted O-methyltransferase YrrM